jgi:hypothetical protein
MAPVRDKGKRANNRDPGYFVHEAESLTGMKHQRVSCPLGLPLAPKNLDARRRMRRWVATASF